MQSLIKNKKQVSKVSLLLFVVLSLNIFPVTVFIGMSLCMAYILLNIGCIVRMPRTDFEFLTSLTCPILIMLAVGLIVGLTEHNDLYEIFKDTYYFIKVIIYLFFGYVYFKKCELDTIIKTFAWFGFSASIIYIVLLSVYVDIGIVDTSSVDGYRKSIPELSYDPLLSIALLLFVTPQKSVLGKFPHFFSFLQIIAVASRAS